MNQQSRKLDMGIYFSIPTAWNLKISNKEAKDRPALEQLTVKHPVFFLEKVTANNFIPIGQTI